MKTSSAVVLGTLLGIGLGALLNRLPVPSGLSAAPSMVQTDVKSLPQAAQLRFRFGPIVKKLGPSLNGFDRQML